MLEETAGVSQDSIKPPGNEVDKKGTVDAPDVERRSNVIATPRDDETSAHDRLVKISEGDWDKDHEFD